MISRPRAARSRVAVQAIDPNPGDTLPLTYAWTASDAAATFDDATQASTNFNAPNASEIVTLTITVTDQRGRAGRGELHRDGGPR